MRVVPTGIRLTYYVAYPPDALTTTITRLALARRSQQLRAHVRRVVVATPRSQGQCENRVWRADRRHWPDCKRLMIRMMQAQHGRKYALITGVPYRQTHRLTQSHHPAYGFYSRTPRSVAFDGHIAFRHFVRHEIRLLDASPHDHALVAMAWNTATTRVERHIIGQPDQETAPRSILENRQPNRY